LRKLTENKLEIHYKTLEDDEKILFCLMKYGLLAEKQNGWL